MQRGLLINKIFISLGLLFVFLVVLALYIGFFDAATAPYVHPGPEILKEIIIIDVSEITDIPSSSGEPVIPVIPPGIPYTAGFVTLIMESADIHRGNLLLVNHDHIYEIPEEQYLISVAETKTGSYRVTDDLHLIYGPAAGPLNEMMDAYKNETGADNIVVISVFRDYSRQQDVLDDYISRLGRTGALQWVALPGHSEHHTGLAVDLGIYSRGTLRTFQGTGDTAWFAENAYRFGFILRFPEDKTGITNTMHEPWHFRYTGELHAYIMRLNNWCLEEYIGILSGHSVNNTFKTVFEDILYEIYYSAGLELLIPLDCDFEISGNNIDGFFVTVMRGNY